MHGEQITDAHVRTTWNAMPQWINDRESCKRGREVAITETVKVARYEQGVAPQRVSPVVGRFRRLVAAMTGFVAGHITF